jgi:hypothetical protein
MAKTRFHPAWVFVFANLGLAIGILLGNWLPVLVALAIGVALSVVAGKTPSQAIRWNKSGVGQALTWVAIVWTTAILLIAMF